MKNPSGGGRGHLSHVLFFIFRERLKLVKTVMSFQRASPDVFLENIVRRSMGRRIFLPAGGADVSDVMLNMNHLHSPAPLINDLFYKKMSISVASIRHKHGFKAKI